MSLACFFFGFGVGYESYLWLFGPILTGLPGDTVVHQFKERLIQIWFGGCLKIGVLGEGAWEPSRLFDLDDEVELCQLHPLLDVEIEG